MGSGVPSLTQCAVYVKVALCGFMLRAPYVVGVGGRRFRSASEDNTVYASEGGRLFVIAFVNHFSEHRNAFR